MMQTLLQRLESLTGPDREVSDLVLLSWGWTRPNDSPLEGAWFNPDGYCVMPAPHPTASIDDALLGVPEGMKWVTGSPHRSQIDSNGPNAAVWPQEQSDPDEYDHFDGDHDDPAIALCIAIVKARGGV